MAGFLVHCDRHWIESPVGTPYFKSVSGSNQPFGSVPSPGFTSTNKHAEDVVDDSESSETSDTDDETCSNRQTSTGGELFSRRFADPGCNIRRKDIICDMRDKHDINLSYNKAYRSKDRALHSVFNMLPAYFHILVKSNLGTVTKIETNRKNRFKYGFMAVGACIEGFNIVIRPSYCRRCYPLEVQDQRCFVSCGVQGWKRGDMINLYYRATYVYRVEEEEFDRLMAELKAMHHKVYDELLEVGIQKFSRVHSPKKRFKCMPINTLCSDFFTTGWLKQAYVMVDMQERKKVVDVMVVVYVLYGIMSSMVVVMELY
ncbi:hypothetical protein Dsin_009073 [Dipteronia sinensis]|uniref:Uncharacterized protein n=1 Tax=Dipteronia sinensis TaxID=43782 RepID=A0AAE0AQD9_9ROSI|nr:hypothetical protein Dsin_009073 [Dipteronia sinensis]